VIYLIINSAMEWLQAHHLGFFRVFRYSEFRAVLALMLSFAIVIALGPRVIRWLVMQKVGDNPEFYHKALNEITRHKSNTPTMGGILISFAILSSTLLLADVTNFYIIMAIVCLIWLSVVGGCDDWLKLVSARRKPGSREGLYMYEKLLFQLGLAVLLGIFIHHYGGNSVTDVDQLRLMSHTLNLPGLKTWEFDPIQGTWVTAKNIIPLGAVPFVVITVFVIAGASNAVNLTDGMDGLVSGIVAVVAFAMMVLAWIAGYDDGELAKRLLVPYIPFSDELAIVAGSMVGACLGFLWFNCAPAQVFMGDTGSLALGGLLGYIAVVIRQEFLLFIIGGIFVVETLSVILQVSYFKLTGGKRIFRCAPIHHHFHLGGWTEQQVVVRFWLISAVLAAAALATLKLR